MAIGRASMVKDLESFGVRESGSVSMVKEHQMGQHKEDSFTTGERMVLGDACIVCRNCCRKLPQLLDSLSISSPAILTLDLVP